MKEQGYMEAYPGSAGEQQYSWLGIDVKYEYWVNEEKEQMDNNPNDDRDMDTVWEEFDK